MTSGIQDNYSVVTFTDGYTSEESPSAKYEEYKEIANIIYYAILIPIGLIGNTLSAIVVLYIAKHHQGRRSIPDILIGVLAFVDLFSIVFIHSISVGAMFDLQWVLPSWLCVYQSFASSTYLKLEFLMQVTISLDRYLALVKPLHYHRVSSTKKVKIVILLVFTASGVMSAVMVGTMPSRANPLETWPLCFYEWNMEYIPHVISAFITCIIFAIGFCIFVYCNTILVRILWTYQARRTNSFLREITDAVNVMDKKEASNMRKTGCGPKADSQRDIKSPPLPSPTIRVRTPSEGQNGMPSLIGNCKETQHSGCDNVTHSHCENNHNGLSTLSQGLSHPSRCGETGLDSHSAGYSDQNEESLAVTQTTQAGDSPKSIPSKNLITNNGHQNLKVTVEIESPTSSPEMAGTPDSQCYLIDEDRSSESMNDRPETLHIPGLSTNHITTRQSNKGASLSLSDSNSSHRASSMVKSPGCSSISTLSSKKRVSINPTPTGEIPRRSSWENEEILPDRVSRDVSRVLAPITLPQHRIGERPVTPVSGQDMGPEQLDQFQTYARKLLKKVGKKVERQKKELLLAQMVILCASVFIATWMPYIVVIVLSWADIKLGAIVKDIAVKLIFANACFNPVFYGICRSNYRKGYLYVTHLCLHYITCCLIRRPGEHRIFYDSKKKKQQQHLDAAEMNHVMRMQTRKRRHAVSEHALQILQQTLHLKRGLSPGGENSKTRLSEFMPSKGLQDLFEHCMQLESELSQSSSSVDYEALALMDLTEANIYENLQKVWSMCVINGDESGYINDGTEDDIDLDIDYDALVAPDVDIGSDDVFFDVRRQEYECKRYECESDSVAGVDLGDMTSSPVRFAMSTPLTTLKQELAKAKKASSV